jgi:MFS family permease
MNTKAIAKTPPAILRWLVLLFISLGMFGNYYIYDSISPLADLLAEQLNFTNENIGLLQGIYSFPNIIMVLIGGIIIDRIGTKKSVMIFTLLVAAGAFITAIHGNFISMVIGRLIFGLGAESMIVAITTLIAVWFKGKQLSFAFGLNLTIARMGSFLAINSPTWGRGMYSHWQDPLWVTVGAGAVALIALAIYFLLDTIARKKYTFEKEEAQDKVLLSDIFKFNLNRVVAAAILIPLSIVLLLDTGFIEIGTGIENILKQILIVVLVFVFTFLNYKAFSRSFWFITLLCVTFYSAMFPFQTFAIKYFQEAHGTTREVGGNLSSILTLAAMIMTPLFGMLADRIGKRSLLMIFGAILIIPVYMLMAYKLNPGAVFGLTDDINITIGFLDIQSAYPPHLIIPLVMMGIAFSLIPAVMWPSVALIADPARLGTAYGLMTMVQNVGLVTFNVMIGYMNDANGAGADNPSGYFPMMYVFSALGFFALAFALILRRNERGPHAHGLEFGSIHKKKSES